MIRVDSSPNGSGSGSPKVQRAAEHLLGSTEADELAETFEALADPTRVRLVSALAEAELSVGELAGLLGMSISAISHQLRLLRRLRLVKRRREGKRIYYALDDEHIANIYRYGLDHVRHK
jgi:DNA-binding transcriptional ArsR family regulator